jgi:hypothetical protein
MSALVPFRAAADQPEVAPPAAGEERAEGEPEKEGGIGRAILLYLPNRAFDLLDPVRARVRVGPGLAVQARVTEAGAVFFGGYTSAFVGAPGPRGKAKLPWPIGVDSRAGVQVSVVEQTSDKDVARGEGMGPHYAPLEIGAGAQLVILGFDVGVAPGELLDFVLGFGFLDLVEDDY